MSLQVFISYARVDNEVPRSSKDLPGFVTMFHDYLDHELKQGPTPRPTLWRDTGNIERTDQFEGILEQEVAHSDFLVVVFSHNWLERDWCRRELDRFRERWADEGEARVRQRILLVNKTPVDRELRPALLQGQEGHDFFAIEKEQHEGAQVQPYFDVGEILDNRFKEQIRELASKLQRLAAGELARLAPVGNMAGPGPRPDQPKGNGRTIFVARPAKDMRVAYDRIANELRGRGCTVVPDAEIPVDDTAVPVIEAALAAAEFSVHALGENHGFAPPEQKPIVDLQLALAAARAAAPHGSGEAAFHRVIWAPKVMEDAAPADPAAPPAAAMRDPPAVRRHFGQDYVAGDEILGDNLSRFIDFLSDHLAKTAPRRAPAAAPVAAGKSVYIDFKDEQDHAYVREVAKALQQRSIQPLIPALDGDPKVTEKVNSGYLRKCDSAVLCWVTASTAWALSEASKLAKSRRPGQKQALPIALLIGPPSNPSKDMRADVKPPEVDCVVDLRDREKPSPQDLDSWLGPAPAAQSPKPAQN